MNTIVILGGGAAGLSALTEFSRRKSFFLQNRIILIDKKETSDFLPLLPDVIGGRLDPESCQVSLGEFTKSRHCEFIRDEVVSLNLTEQKISLRSNAPVAYDFLLGAVGSETNFYDKSSWKPYVFTLDDVKDALVITHSITHSTGESPLLIIGGGYTGIEIATNLARRFKKLKKNAPEIIIVEISKSILNALPEWMQLFVKRNMEMLHIKILTETSLVSCSSESATLSNGATFEKPMIFWMAGVRTPKFFDTLTVAVDKQKRIVANKDLSFGNHAYAAGDCCDFMVDNKSLRMAFHFAISEGRCAAKNIINEIAQKPTRQFQPADLGLIVPMANAQACGFILGNKTSGRLPWLMHYCMSVYRSWSWNAKINIIRNLLLNQPSRRQAL